VEGLRDANGRSEELGLGGFRRCQWVVFVGVEGLREVLMEGVRRGGCGKGLKRWTGYYGLFGVIVG
jgi:hypothetical protein